MLRKGCKIDMSRRLRASVEKMGEIAPEFPRENYVATELLAAGYVGRYVDMCASCNAEVKEQGRDR